MRNGGWDHEEFKHYVRRAAANMPNVNTQADIARAADVAPSLLSKWFRGEERPSVESLKKIAKLPGVRLDALMKLAGHSDDPDTAVTPPPPRVVDPLVRDLDDLLAADSRVPDVERDDLRTALVVVMRPYQRYLRRRRTA